MPNYNADKPASSHSQALKQVPQNIEAEKSVLAACMLNRDAIDEVAVQLRPECFFRRSHQLIFASMMDLHSRNMPIDHISLAENLKATGQLEAVGGKAYLVELADNAEPGRQCGEGGLPHHLLQLGNERFPAGPAHPVLRGAHQPGKSARRLFG